jgi:putative spermidine/putrescine transport system substrate-binding protein
MTARRPRTSPLAWLPLTCVLVAAALGGVTRSMAASGDKPFAGQTLVVLGMQQNIIDTVRPTVDKAFKELTGADVQWNPGQAPDNLAKLLAARGGAPPYDVVFLDSVEQTRAIQAKVVQRIDPKQIPGWEDLPAGAWANTGYGPGFILIRLGSCVNTQQYKAHNVPLPSGIDGWFDPRLGDHIALPGPGNFYWPVAIPAFADHYGIAYTDPQPLMTRFASVKALSLFTSSGDAQAMMSSGKAWLVPLTDGRCLNLKIGGQPVEFAPLNLRIRGKTYPWVRLVDTWDIPVGVSEQKAALARQFIGVMEGPALLPLVHKFGYIPANRKVLAEAQKDPKLRELLPSDFDFDTTYSPDYAKFLPQLQSWIDAWNRVFLK